MLRNVGGPPALRRSPLDGLAAVRYADAHSPPKRTGGHRCKQVGEPSMIRLPDRPYHADLQAAVTRADELAVTFKDSLASAIHMGLIDALNETAKIQDEHPQAGRPGFPRTSFRQEQHDGFYEYHGSIDTPHVAEFLTLVVRQWLSKNRD